MANEKKVEEAARWLREVVNTWGSVDWEWISEQTTRKFFSDNSNTVHLAYWYGYNEGWYVRGLASFGDLGVSLMLGDGAPLLPKDRLVK